MRFLPGPDNFRVEEDLLFEPAGHGDHLWLVVQKRGCDTLTARRMIAARSGIQPRDIGYAGMKDALAVTVQTFSLPVQDLQAEEVLGRLSETDDARVRVLSWRRHTQRLRVGQLAGNRFFARLGVRSRNAPSVFRTMLGAARDGIPNSFGPQRFGRGRRNVELGKAWLAGELRAKHEQARIYLAALQAAVFQRVLEMRAAAGIRACAGDVWVVPGRRSEAWRKRLECAPDEGSRRRRGLLVPSAPLPGHHVRWCEGVAGEIERRAAAEVGWPEAVPRTVRGIRVDGMRRPLVVFPGKVSCTPSPAGVWAGFTLPSGAYGTVFLDRLLSACERKPAPLEPIISACSWPQPSP